MSKSPGNASNKDDKIKGSSGKSDDELNGGSGSEVVDGKSGDDNVAGGGGDDWVKGGSGDDHLRYNATEHSSDSTYYDGGSHIDTLLLELNYEQWMDLTLQQDLSSLLPWIQDQLNGSGQADGHEFDFNAFDLTIRKFEELGAQVDGVELSPEDDPVTLDDDSYTVDEDAFSVDGNVLANDEVPDLVRRLEIITPTSEGTIVIDDRFGDFTYSFDDAFQFLAVGESATQTFQYKVSDADLDFGIATAKIVITGVNDAPIASDDSDQVDENDTALLDVLGNDFDIDASDVHTIDEIALISDGRDVAAPGGAPTILNINDQIQFTTGEAYDYLAVGESDTASIAYIMSDPHGADSSANLDVTIIGLNDAPIAADDSAQIDENDAIVVDVLDNDFDIDASDEHTVDEVTLLSDGRDAAAPGVAPTLQIVDDQIQFTTGEAYDYLAVGETDTANISYTISDPHGADSSASLEVTITGLNDAPVAVDDSQQVDENEAITVDVLANDFDIDASDLLSLDDVTLIDDGRSAVAQGAGPTLQIVNGEVRFSTGTAYDYLAAGEIDTVSISYTLSDQHGAESSAMLELAVIGVNDAPVANDDSSTTYENTDRFVNVIANDTDLDASDTLKIDAVRILDDGRSGPLLSEGNLLVLNNDAYIKLVMGTAYDFLPLGEITTAILEYDMSDDNGGSDTAQIAVQIRGVNDAPVAVDDSLRIGESETGFSDVLENDFDVDRRDAMLIKITEQPDKGKALVVDGEIRFDTNGEFSNLGYGDVETVVIRYSVQDRWGATDTAKVYVTIVGANDAPIANMDEASTTESESIKFNVLSNDIDPDGDSITLISARLVYGDGEVSLASGNRIEYDPDGQYDYVGPGQQAEVIIEYTIQDSAGLESTSAAFVVINGEFDAPNILENLPSQDSQMTFELANTWHYQRYYETGTSSTMDFGAPSSPDTWDSGFSLGFDGQSIFGDNDTSVTGESAGVEENPGRKTLFDIDGFSEALGTGASFKASFKTGFEFSLTPYAEILGGSVDVDHKVNTYVTDTVVDENGYWQLSTSSAADAGNSIDVDTPDNYNIGFSGNLDASMSFDASAKAGILGITKTWSKTSSLFDEDKDFTLLGAGVDTKDGKLDLTVFEQDFALEDGVALPRGVGEVYFYDEHDDTATTTTTGGTTSTETQQKVTGIKLDVDDILGQIPGPVGKAFANLDNSQSFGADDWLDLSIDYTVVGLDFIFDFILDVDSQTSAEFTVDLLFDRPVRIEGTDWGLPVVAIRNADWNNLPGIKSFDGSPVSVIPLFNTQLNYNNDVSLNLGGTLDFEIGEFDASIEILGEIDKSVSINPLVDESEELFNLDLIEVVGVSMGVQAIDQAGGNAFLLG